MPRSARPLILALPGPLLAACSAVPSSFESSGPQSYSTLSTFVILLVLSAVLFALVLGLLVYSMIRFRARPGAPEPEQVHGNTRLEVGWTTFAAVLIGIAFVLSVGSMLQLAQPGENPLRVKVIGRQWWWEYQYPDLGVTTANELHLPTGVPLRIEVESADVLHSYWLPEFGRMIDAIPGRTNVIFARLDEPGILEGTCNQYCGTQHAWMRVVGVAQPKAEFDAWVAQQKQSPVPPTGSLARGQDLFLRNTCVSCHAIAGTAAQGRVGPDLTHLGSRETLGSGVAQNTVEELTRWLRDAQGVKPGVRMPPFDLPEADLRAMAEYLHSLK